MLSPQATVSVIIPCRDARDTLAAAIRSVLDQTVPPLEVLVIDDRSRDDSAAVAASFGPPVRVLAGAGRGPGAARRIGVEAAGGRYIAFVDADDVVHPAKHERQLAVLLGARTETVVHTGATLRWLDGRHPPRPRADAGRAAGRCTRVIFESNPVCGASVMMRRELILALGNFREDLPISEDYAMWLAASTCADFVHLPEPLYHITRHAGNITARPGLRALCHFKAQEGFRRAFPEAFNALPAESIRRCMVEPVLAAARQAWWRRDERDGPALLDLAARLAPQDRQIRRLRRLARLPMGVVRLWDRLAGQAVPAAEAR